ncbi:MAG TPA: hypothetical protein VMI06_08265 [Terriglobia bacterium]|nr:hypothetical protein [Terriglobia bacterium]
MRQNNRFEVAATIALGVLCTFLILRLIVRVRSVNAGTRRLDPAVRQPVRRAARLLDPLLQRASAYPDTPVLNVSLFDRLQAQPFTAPDRDPFSFTPTPQETERLEEQHKQETKGRPTGPPPPPPVPLKALGYVQDSQGQFEAYLTDSENIYAVREGEKFDKVYQVLKITPAFVEVEDDSLSLRAQLAIPQ